MDAQPSVSQPATKFAENREIFCADAFAWLEENASPYFANGISVVTSLPDLMEIEAFMDHGSLSPDEYKVWVQKAASAILSRLRFGQIAIFYQSDSKNMVNGLCTEWIDKAFYIQLAAHKLNCTQLFHKIALLNEPNKIKFARPSYSHVISFCKNPVGIESTPSLTEKNLENIFAYDTNLNMVLPDVRDRGEMLWRRGMGLAAALGCVKFAQGAAEAKIILDPFCGKGTVLAVANALGLKSIGVDVSSTRCNNARKLCHTTEDLDRLLAAASSRDRNVFKVGQMNARIERQRTQDKSDSKKEAECPAGHRLQPLKVVSEDIMCNTCLKEGGEQAADEWFSCRTCDWDVCASCCQAASSRNHKTNRKRAKKKNSKKEQKAAVSEDLSALVLPQPASSGGSSSCTTGLKWVSSDFNDGTKNPACSNSHALTKLQMSVKHGEEDMLICDLCNAEIMPSGLSCRRCDFDVCDSCSRRSP